MANGTTPSSRTPSRELFMLLLLDALVIVGEDDVSPGELGAIRRLEALHGLGLAMSFVCGFILENKEVHKTGRIVFLLPGQVHASAWLAGLYIANECFDGSLAVEDFAPEI